MNLLENRRINTHITVCTAPQGKNNMLCLHSVRSFESVVENGRTLSVLKLHDTLQMMGIIFIIIS